MPHLQLKDLPSGLHDSLRQRSRAEGISMREYVVRLIQADLGERDTRGEMIARWRDAPQGSKRVDAAASVGDARSARERQLLPRPR